jgi:hypothetical protein
MGQTYTFVASSTDGRASFLDLRSARNRDEATQHAHALLADHRSCDRVEIWSANTQVTVVERESADAAPHSGGAG